MVAVNYFINKPKFKAQGSIAETKIKKMDNQTELQKLLREIIESVSDRNSCLTQLAKGRLQIMKTIDKMSFNDGNDANGNWAKLKELKEQADKIDNLIRDISNK